MFSWPQKSLIKPWIFLWFTGERSAVSQGRTLSIRHFFFLQDLSPLFVFKSSLCQLVVPRPDAAEQFITIITTGTILNCTSLHFFFPSVRKMFWTAFYTAGHPDVMENRLAVNNVFFRRGKKTFVLNTRVFSKHLSKAAREKLNCSVPFELISQMQYGAIFCLFFFVSTVQHRAAFLNGSADLGARVYISICSSIHLSVCSPVCHILMRGDG